MALWARADVRPTVWYYAHYQSAKDAVVDAHFACRRKCWRLMARTHERTTVGQGVTRLFCTTLPSVRPVPSDSWLLCGSVPSLLTYSRAGEITGMVSIDVTDGGLQCRCRGQGYT